jgi:heme oxygenase
VLDETLLDSRQRLKQATANAHASLESLVGTLDSHAAYVRYLRGTHAFRTSIEHWLSSARSFDTDWRPQRLSEELAQDLADIGVTPLNDRIEFTPSPRSDGFTLGVHYVLEGSALGARILCKQVEALGLNREHGARHLWAQAASLEPWRAFVSLLQRQTARDFDDMAAGANAAFATASVAMQKAAHG